MTPHADWKPKYNPWIIALTVTLATFMEVLDTSIANVALPHIAGNLSATIRWKKSSALENGKQKTTPRWISK